MEFLIIAMLVTTALGVAVVGAVAVPAHRDGRDVLTEKGEGVARSARRITTLARTRASRTR